jgi:hypothetical protein
MSKTVQESPKPGSLVTDQIVPDKAAAVSFSDLHTTALDVAQTSAFRAGINLHSTRIINSAAPVDPGDLITHAYYVQTQQHIMSNKGDLITHDGTDQVILPVGTAGQVLSVQAAAATGIAWVNIPDNHVTQDVTFTGPWAAGITQAFYWEKFGSMSYMRMVACQGAALNLVAATAPAGSIPVAYRPATVQQNPIVIMNNSTQAAGSVILNPDGSMAIAPDSGAFGAAGNVGFYDEVLGYCLL